MLAVNIAIMAGLVIYKYYLGNPLVQYTYLLATYDLGFMKRALVGTVLALFDHKVKIIDVFVIALAAWLVTMALFVLLFKRTFGFAGDRFALFVFAFGSPFFFKNLFHTYGFFDIYGCLFAIVVLLIPVNRLFPLVVGAGSAALVLIHHLHFLLYVPTIAVIAVIRFYCLRPFSPLDIVYGGIAALPVLAAFMASMFFGNAPVAPAQLIEQFRTRAADPLIYTNISIWYTSMAEELAKTAAEFPKNGPRLPVFFAFIALHWPLIRFMRRLHSAIAAKSHRLIVLLGIAGITAGYVNIFIFVYDYGRWFSSWFICMILLMHAMARLQAHSRTPPPAFSTPETQKGDVIYGWIVTAIPRVGLQIPF